MAYSFGTFRGFAVGLPPAAITSGPPKPKKLPGNHSNRKVITDLQQKLKDPLLPKEERKKIEKQLKARQLVFV
jgi:hypothetical protein